MNYESILLVVQANKLKSSINLVLRLIQDRPVVYINLIKHHNLILDDLKEEGINTGKISFVDCVTELVGGKTREKKNVLFVRKPSDLSGIGIAISKFVNSIRGEKWIILDSLKVLGIYNDEETVLMFLRSLLENASRHYVKVIFMTTKGKDMGMINKVLQLVDKSDIY